MKLVYVELDKCYPLLTSQAQHNWDVIEENNKIESFCQLCDDMFNENVRISEIDDYIKYEFDSICETLGIDLGYDEEPIEEAYLSNLISNMAEALKGV